VLLPTAACLEATCTTIVDEAFEREGVSWLQRSLVTAMAGDPAKLMARELSNYSLATVLDVWLTTDRVPAAQAEAVLARAGVAGVLRERSDLSIDDLNSEPGSETGPIPESPPAKGARDAGG
jgi:hypothetical protein